MQFATRGLAQPVLQLAQQRRRSPGWFQIGVALQVQTQSAGLALDTKMQVWHRWKIPAQCQYRLVFGIGFGKDNGNSLVGQNVVLRVLRHFGLDINNDNFIFLESQAADQLGV
ncbi:hypothetical protein MUN86_28760 (plasmid) [Hymenobacter volaticus]|uniref:Uncharacterized protein n=1 Tax=Hymenobacter volaticus TaxID=2932254 RepID=A0ABY4GFI4_9BACT|nr:hypothetical protein [Hymenobacter volaticus]UOQ69472.1 hypothetical protein MUN86_28760 [Hymenobacter volaticus]